MRLFLVVVALVLLAFYFGLSIGSKDARIVVRERLLRECTEQVVITYKEGVSQ